MWFQKGSASKRGLWSRRSDIAALVLLYTGVTLIPLLFWPWSLDTFVGPKFLAMRVITAGAAISAATTLVLGRSSVRLRTPDWAAIVFLVLNVFAFAVSVDPTTSLFGEPLQQAGLLATFAFAGTYAVARLTIRSFQRLRGLLAAAALGATIVAAYGLVQIAGLDPLWDALPKGRVFSLVGQPNWLGAYLVMTVPLTVALGVTERNWRVKAALTGSVIVQIVVLVASLSRAAWLGLVAVVGVGVVIAVARYSHGTFANWLRAIVVAVVSAVIVVAVLLGLGRTTSSITPGAVLDRAASTLDFKAFDVGRYFALWEVALAITADHPLVGTGPDSYATVFPNYRDQVLDRRYADYLSDFRPESPHNVYLAYATGTGVPALIAYVTLLASTVVLLVRTAKRRGRSSTLLLGILAAVAGHLVTDAFMTIDLAASWLFWCCLGAAVAAVDYEVRKTASTTHKPDPVAGHVKT